MRLLVFGYGDIGRAFARRLAAEGWEITATARSDADRALQAKDGAASIDPAKAGQVRADALLITAPPGPDGCPALAAEVIAPWTAYLSTTGVYGDHAGRWVFEETPLTPQSDEGRRRAEAETTWLALGACTFRLPGLYGPGRSAFDRLRDGTARRITRQGQIFSRAHTDDVASALAASLAQPRPGAAYNICDDEPAPNAEVIAEAARLLGLPTPPEEPFETAELSAAARRFYGESKRVSNALAKAELGWRPAYRTYREGLRAILAAGG